MPAGVRTLPAPVTVAVITYRRNDDLAELLPQLLVELRGSGRRGRVLVVDNDPHAGARDVVAAVRSPEVHYEWEPRPGIAAARNRALAAAEYGVLVFIDDDERPVAGWLALLLATQAGTGAAAVVGPVVSEFAREPSAWVTAGGFFTRRRLPTGTRVEVAASNNLLLDLAAVRRLRLTFDERFGLTGGSDYMFTRRLHLAGELLVWCDEAVVLDKVPAQRSTVRWVLRRSFRTGNGSAVIDIDLAPPGRHRTVVRVAHAGRGLVRVAGGLGKWCLGALTGSLALKANGARNLARGAGLLAGAGGVVYGEYRRPPSSLPADYAGSVPSAPVARHAS